MLASDSRTTEPKIFDMLGVRPVLNCCGVYTDLGGTILSPTIWQATEELNGSFVRMTELLHSASAMVARLVGAEAARITPGASAAIALSVGAAMTGCDGARWEQLPDTSGLKYEVIMARSHLRDYKYASCARMSGATLVPAGPDHWFDLQAIVDAVGPQTACVFIPAHLLDGFNGVDKLSELVAAVHALDVPVIVDAAYMSYPIDLLPLYAKSGADLTCFSAKYFGGPNSGGFVSGSAKLIKAVEGLDFTGFESGPFRIFGRPFKMSRYDVAATALALQEWLVTDHSKRWEKYARKVAMIAAVLPKMNGVTVRPRFFTMDENVCAGPLVNCLAVEFSPTFPKKAADVANDLADGNPIIAGIVREDMLILAVDALVDGMEAYVGSRLGAALT